MLMTNFIYLESPVLGRFVLKRGSEGVSQCVAIIFRAQITNCGLGL